MIAALAILCALAPAQVGTSTAATYQAAAIRCVQKLKNEKSKAVTSVHELALAQSRVAESKAKNAHKITRTSRAWSVAGAVTFTIGLAVLALERPRCRSPTCRDLLGIGGGTAVLLGTGVTLLAW